MYLENSEPAKVSGEVESSTEAVLAEQCDAPKRPDATNLNVPPKDAAAELGIKVLLEYAEQIVSRELDSSLLHHCKMSRHEGDCKTYCNGHSESFVQHSTSNGFFESNSLDNGDNTSGLIPQLDTFAQHFDCLTSFEQSANHSLTCNKHPPCCEHCTEHLGLFQQCKLSGQQCDSLDKVEVKCNGFRLCEMSNFIPGSGNSLKLPQQYELYDQQSECFDSELETSTDDSEPNISDSVDSLDCGDEDCEYDDEIQNQTDCTNSDDNDYDEQEDEESCPYERCETEATLSENINSSHFNAQNFDDDRLVSSDSECSDEYQEMAEESPTLDMSTDQMCGNTDFVTSEEHETSQQCAASEKTSDSLEFCTEEDSFSDCSSVETKSFRTCRDDSVSSEPSSDSSGESEKGAQEDSSDEQTQWESFEDDDDMEQNRTNGSKTKLPTADAAIDNYFDLFDRADYYGHPFASKRYVSCFDGGDIHECLYLEEAAKHAAKNVFTYEEANEGNNAEDACEEAAELRTGDDCESEKCPEDWILEDEETEGEVCVFYAENYEEDEDELDGEMCATNGYVYEISEDEEEEVEDYLSSSSEENMFAPRAEDISVEGDAYEDEFFDKKIESLIDCPSTFEDVKTTEDNEPEAFIECSEAEPYWSLIGKDGDGVMYCPDVEDYYAYQIKSVQSTFKQALNGLILVRIPYDQVICAKDGGCAPSNEREDDLPSKRETELQDSGVCPAVSNGIVDISGLSENFASCCAVDETAIEQTPQSDTDSELNGNSPAVGCPLNVIHSVVSDENDCTQSRDSDEEESDDESCESCDCEYCIPPKNQVPSDPLLPRIESKDTEKICVIIDLDETLVHSSFKPVNNPDFIIPVEIEETLYQVYVLKRPYVDEFLRRMGELFECVLFTASLAKYADPVSDMLDVSGAFQSRLFRESCVFHKGNYVKDLSRLGRDLNKVIIFDNSPASYIFHPENAVPVGSWFDDTSDTELLDLIPFFENLSKADNVYDVLKQLGSPS